MSSNLFGEEKDKNPVVNCNPKVTVNKSMPDFSKDPFFVKKGERDKASLEKYGVPEILYQKK